MRTCRRSDFQWKHIAAFMAAKDFAPLRALEIRVEDEAALVEPLEQNHPDIRHAVRVDGRQRHAVRVVGLALGGVVQPFGEQPERLGALGEVTRLLTLFRS